MGKRESVTRGTKPATEAQKAAGRANLSKGRTARAEALASKPDAPRAKDRWSQLLSGTITVKDLDDDEISKMRVKGKGGTFSGRAPAIPSHLAREFHQEAIRRAKQKIAQATPKVTKLLLEMAEDSDVKDSDRIKILMYLMDRQLGKTPETIRVEGESDFDKMLADAVGLDRGMADAASEDERRHDAEGAGS